MSLLIAAVLFGVFAANIGLGSMGRQVFLGDVGEMLVLLAASIFFVAAILKREAARQEKDGGA